MPVNSAKPNPPDDPPRNWHARFVTSDGHLLEAFDLEGKTNVEAIQICDLRKDGLGYSCDDYSLEEKP